MEGQKEVWQSQKNNMET